jgi:hypothetical protein
MMDSSLSVLASKREIILKTVLIFLLISFSAMASNWMPLSVIQSSGVAAYSLEKDCESISKEECLDIGEEPGIIAAGKVSVENDWGPELEVEACADQSACQSALESKQCMNGQKFISDDYTRVYCVELIGKKLVKDLAGWSALKTANAQKQALEAGIQFALRLQDCGKRVMALVLVRNQPKGLTPGQVKQMVSAYANIKQLLESGSLVSAKEEIQAVVADGVLVTTADKAALTQEIDKCLGL